MWTLRFPNELKLAAFRLRQGRLPTTHPQPGCTRTETVPAGFVRDHTRAQLGDGPEVFAAAKQALRAWTPFPGGWVRAEPPDTPIRVGAVVAVVARAFGVWISNACRIEYVIDEPDRWGFGYATLPGHVECGEERFLVEQRPDGSVWFDVFAVSRPRHWLVRVGYPVARRFQKRFGREAAAAMRRAVQQTAVMA